MWLFKVSIVLLPGILGVKLQNYQLLTENFFENLRANPILDVEDDGHKNFIDSQINNYIQLVTGESNNTNKKKRSLSLDQDIKNDTGVYLLKEVKASATIPVKFPSDIYFFKQNSTWFVAALESPTFKENADHLLIFLYNDVNSTFREVARTPVTNAVKLSVINSTNFTLITVAENDTTRADFKNKSGIFLFDSSGLKKIQSIDMHYSVDIVMWKIHDDICMSYTQSKADIPIYKWLGRHFDLVQTIKSSSGVKKVTPFRIGSFNFLAVANNKTRSYSEIYKYDYDTDKFELYQKILTWGCSDIEIFSISGRDTFMIVANQQRDSIVYKFVDSYFIPFQTIHLSDVEQWIPVSSSSSKFALLAICRYDGLKFFQYDGWSFLETPQKLEEGLITSGLKSVRFVDFDNSSTIIVISNKNNHGKSPNVFQLKFSFQNSLNEFYQEMLSWCDQGLQKIDNLLQSDIFDIVLGKPERADIDEDEVSSKIDSLSSIFDEISANEIIFNNVTFLQNVNTSEINDFSIENVFNNVLNIEEGFDIDNMSLSLVKIGNTFSTNTVNGFDNDTIIHNSDNFDTLIVSGVVTVPEGVTIKGKLNNMSIDQNLLLRNGDQNFTQPLILSSIKANRMTAEQLPTSPIKTDHVENLVVKDLSINGYINDVDIVTLDKYTLKKQGDQIITGEFTFDTLRGKNLESVGKVSGRKLNDIIDADNGNYTISQVMIFKNDIFVRDLEVSKSLNGIEVIDGGFDILLKNTTDEQEISGEKIFDDVIIYNAIYLQGRIKGKNFDKMNPVVSVTDNLLLEGDKIISGQVQIEDFLSADDIVTSDGSYSLRKLQNEGLKLTSKDIQPHLSFSKLLNVNEIFVDTINNKNPDDFVVTGLEKPQIIQGSKTFIEDLKITGPTNVLKINNVDVEDLDNKILKIEGDQTINGKHHIKHIIADKITAEITEFDKSVEWNIKNNGNLTINDNLEVDFIKTRSLVVQGMINNLEFDKIVDDSVRKDKIRIIASSKYFTNITVDNLNVDRGVSFDNFDNEFDKIELEGPLDIKNIKIENLNFDGDFNGVDRDNFGKYDDQVSMVDNNHTFDRMIVYGNVYISSNKINDVDITELAENTVKIDEAFDFDTVSFEEIISKNLSLEGDIENVDLDNLFVSSKEISDNKFFNSDVIINGTVTINSLLNNFNLSKFCHLATNDTSDKNVTINGDAYFAKGPNVAEINNIDIDSIKNRGWFSDQDTTLTGSVEFEDVIFQNEVDIGGFVDNISITLLYDNYFSKTKDQEIPATFTFDNDVIFDSDVTIGSIIGSSNLNDINLDEFVRTALIDDYDQMFEAVPFFENCFVQNLTGDFSVNGLDLSKDVMRYDKVNMVVGRKIFDNLNVTYLKLEENIKIQDVDILDWFKNSVLRTTVYNITGIKRFNNANFTQGFLLKGGINGLIFDADHIMLKNIQQDITGQKIFHASQLRPVYFKGIKLKGFINDVDISDLINSQAYKNQDNVFKTRINFNNNITTNNLIIKKTYQGVNMTELITNVTNLGILNNLLDQYYKLIPMSNELKNSIEKQSFFVHHYKIIQTIPSILNSQKILCPDDVTRLGTVVGDTMELYGFENHRLNRQATIKFFAHPVYIDQVLMGRYIYIQEKDDLGHFIQITTKNMSFISVSANLTSSTTSFINPKSTDICTLFTYLIDQPRIYCIGDRPIKLMQILDSPIATKASSVVIGEDVYLLMVIEPMEAFESRIDLWKYSNSSGLFEFDQSLFATRAISMTTVSYNGRTFLAIASGHLQNAMYSGSVEIYTFDEDTLKFRHWHSLEMDAPTQVDFAILPSKELILYVVSDNPTEPLLIFRYEGITGFKLKVKGSAMPNILYLNQFSRSGSHFIVVQSQQEINVVKAIFKGEEIELM